MNTKFQYIPKEKRTNNENKASRYTNTMMKSQFNRFANTNLLSHQEILHKGYFTCQIFFVVLIIMRFLIKLRMKSNVKFPSIGANIINMKIQIFLKYYNEIVQKMAEHFKVKIIQTRLNYYHDGSDWKPFHHDSHAYSDKDENFTMGASFGDSRELVFLHEESNNKFTFPQNNGDVFAFDKEVNKEFMHGVPKSSDKHGERFSIIAWGEKN